MGLDDGDPAADVIHDPSWPLLPPGLRGLHLRLTVADTLYEVPILGNTHNSIQVEGGLSAVIPAGTHLAFVLKLDRLTLRDGGQFYFPGTLEAGDINHEPGRFTSLWVGRTSLPNPLNISDRRVRLIVDNPDFAEHDVTLTNAHLFLEKPITLRDRGPLPPTPTGAIPLEKTANP